MLMLVLVLLLVVLVVLLLVLLLLVVLLLVLLALYQLLALRCDASWLRATVSTSESEPASVRVTANHYRGGNSTR
jgi:hypothetical protein